MDDEEEDDAVLDDRVRWWEGRTRDGGRGGGGGESDMLLNESIGTWRAARKKRVSVIRSPGGRSEGVSWDHLVVSLAPLALLQYRLGLFHRVSNLRTPRSSNRTLRARRQQPPSHGTLTLVWTSTLPRWPLCSLRVALPSRTSRERRSLGVKRR